MAVREESRGGVAVPVGAVVEARGLTRRYGEGTTAVDALRGVDLAVGTGELVAMAGATLLVTATVWDGRSRRREGAFLVAAYAAAVLGFLLGGGR